MNAAGVCWRHKLVSAAKRNDATIPSKYIRKGVVVGGGSGADGKR